MSTTAVRVTGLTKRFGDVQALAGIDFEIPEGTIFGLLGPNGAGKTTAVRILATVHRPDAGTAERQAQLRHWTAEAMAIVRGRVHWEIVRLSRQPEYRADCRWIAGQAGVSVDEVNLALTRLLRLGLIDGHWKARPGIARSN